MRRMTIPLGAVTALVANVVSAFRLNQGLRTRAVRLFGRVNITKTGAGTVVRNQGSLWALFQDIGLYEAGKPRYAAVGRILRFLAELQAPNVLPSSRLADAAIGAATLEEGLIIHFASPIAVNPSETAYVQDKDTNLLEVRVKSDMNLAHLTDAAGTVDSVNITAEQIADDKIGELPLYIPRLELVHDVAIAAAGSVKLELNRTRPIQALIIQQDTDQGAVSDIVESLALRGQDVTIIGPDEVAWENLIQAQAAEFGGDVVGDRSIVVLWFRPEGKLTQMLDPNADPNLRLHMTAAPSAVAGASGSRVKVWSLEMSREAGHRVAPVAGAAS